MIPVITGTAVVTVGLLFASVATASEPLPPCDGEPMPRAGSEIPITNPWVTITGAETSAAPMRHDVGTHVDPGGQQTDKSLERPDVATPRVADPRVGRMAPVGTAVFGMFLEQLDSGEHTWTIGEEGEGRFTVADDAVSDDTPPRAGHGELTVQQRFVDIGYRNYGMERGEDWNRQWRIEFPVGDDDISDKTQLRYLVTTSPVDDSEPVGQVLLTPAEEDATDDRLQFVLENYPRDCHHPRPLVGEHSELEVAVSTVDLAGNVSEDAASTTVVVGEPPEPGDDPEWRDIRSGDSTDGAAEQTGVSGDDSPTSGCAGCASADETTAGLIPLVVGFLSLLILWAVTPLRCTTARDAPD